MTCHRLRLLRVGKCKCKMNSLIFAAIHLPIQSDQRWGLVGDWEATALPQILRLANKCRQIRTSTVPVLARPPVAYVPVAYLSDSRAPPSSFFSHPPPLKSMTDRKKKKTNVPLFIPSTGSLQVL